jgi:putative ABC transport system permease protein
VALIIRLVVSAAFFAILMIVGNTMIMAVRERTKEIGVMKTLGFSSARILRMVLSESVLLSVGGAILGLALSAALLAGLAPFVREFFGAVSVSGQVLATGLGLALLLGLVTGVVPALNAFNMKIVDALGRK